MWQSPSEFKSDVRRVWAWECPWWLWAVVCGGYAGLWELGFDTDSNIDMTMVLYLKTSAPASIRQLVLCWLTLGNILSKSVANGISKLDEIRQTIILLFLALTHPDNWLSYNWLKEAELQDGNQQWLKCVQEVFSPKNFSHFFVAFCSYAVYVEINVLYLIHYMNKIMCTHDHHTHMSMWNVLFQCCTSLCHCNRL